MSASDIMRPIARSIMRSIERTIAPTPVPPTQYERKWGTGPLDFRRYTASANDVRIWRY